MATNYTGKYPVIEIKIDNAKKIGEKANELAYKTNTSKANWPNGKPTEAFRKAFKIVYKGFHFWNAWSKEGFSCDVFVGTCVRAAGVVKNFPAGLWKQLAYLKKHCTIIKAEIENTRDGDIFFYRKNKIGKHGHIGIIYGGQVKEASAKHYAGKTVNALKTRLSKEGKKYVYVFRWKPTIKYDPLKKGSKGENVERLQKYLNWYFGKSYLKIDGDFGPITEKRVKIMQEKMKLKADGIVGKLTLAKMKEFKK